MAINSQWMSLKALACTALVVAAFPVEAANSDATFKTLQSKAPVKAALEQIRREDERTLKEQIEIAETPSPSRKEEVRAKDYVRRLQALGLTAVSIDSEGNVVARRAGVSRSGPTLVVP